MTTVPEPLDVLTLGETMALLVAQEPGPLEQVQTFSKRLAGADSNVAIGLARLGFKVGWVSRLGADSFGRYVRQAIEAEGVDTSQVAVDPNRSTGFMLKSCSLDGSDPAIEYYRRNSAASQLGMANLPSAYALRARHLHATGITPALSPAACEVVADAMQSLRAAGRSVSFDPNLRPRLWPDTATMRDTLNDLARHADWVLPGIEEGRLLTGEQTPEAIAAFYRRQGASLVVIKLGAEGAYYDSSTEGSGYVAGFPVAKVIDTVGAGDGFAAGLVSALLEGKTVPEAVRRGSWIGARAVQVLGDTEGLPTRAQLDEAGL